MNLAKGKSFQTVKPLLLQSDSSVLKVSSSEESCFLVSQGRRLFTSHLNDIFVETTAEVSMHFLLIFI